MTVNGKRIPFIAERLGVKVGEKFRIAEMAKLRDGNGLNVVFMIRDDGTYTTIPENVRNSSLAILKAIDDPEHQVIKLLDISDHDRKALEAFWSIWADPNTTITVLGEGRVRVNASRYNFKEEFYCSPFFYSIPKNKEYKLWDLISGDVEDAK